MSDSKEYGNCEGPESVYVKLVSSDGHEFVIKRKHAVQSGIIKAMLSGPGAFLENDSNEIKFREIPSLVLEKICHYLAYKARYTGELDLPNFDLPAELCLEVLMAANFLQC